MFWLRNKKTISNLFLILSFQIVSRGITLCMLLGGTQKFKSIFVANLLIQNAFSVKNICHASLPKLFFFTHAIVKKFSL